MISHTVQAKQGFFTTENRVQMVAKKRRYGQQLPIGELAGVTITRKMLRGKVAVSKPVLEFIQFCEAMNRGAI